MADDGEVRKRTGIEVQEQHEESGRREVANREREMRMLAQRPTES